MNKAEIPVLEFTPPLVELDLTGINEYRRKCICGGIIVVYKGMTAGLDHIGWLAKCDKCNAVSGAYTHVEAEGAIITAALEKQREAKEHMDVLKTKHADLKAGRPISLSLMDAYELSGMGV